jgi:CBS domain-containing protein
MMSIKVMTDRMIPAHNRNWSPCTNSRMPRKKSLRLGLLVRVVLVLEKELVVGLVTLLDIVNYRFWRKGTKKT